MVNLAIAVFDLLGRFWLSKAEDVHVHEHVHEHVNDHVSDHVHAHVNDHGLDPAP